MAIVPYDPNGRSGLWNRTPSSPTRTRSGGLLPAGQGVLKSSVSYKNYSPGPKPGTPSAMRKDGQPGTDWDAFIADLLNGYAGGGGGGGGYGGGGYGGGGGGNGGAIMAAIAAAKAEYDQTNAKVGDLYGDLAKTYEPLEGQTKQRYDQAIAAAQSGTADLVASIRGRADREQAAAQEAATRMGIAAPAAANADPATQQGAEADYAAQQLQLQSNNWAGLMGAGREAQRGRDVANLQGARDAGTLAQEELRKQYEAYVEQLKGQIVAGGGGGGGGGGGYRRSGGGSSGGSRTGNKLLDNMNQAMLTYALAQKGIYSNQWSYSAYRPREATGAAALGLSPAAYNRAAAQYAAQGSGAASKYIQGGGSPSTAEHFRKVFGG